MKLYRDDKWKNRGLFNSTLAEIKETDTKTCIRTASQFTEGDSKATGMRGMVKSGGAKGGCRLQKEATLSTTKAIESFVLENRIWKNK